jgi:hypothetical protein
MGLREIDVKEVGINRRTEEHTKQSIFSCVVIKKMAVFWVVALWCLVEVY